MSRPANTMQKNFITLKKLLFLHCVLALLLSVFERCFENLLC